MISTLTNNVHFRRGQGEKDFLERITAEVFTVKAACKLNVGAGKVFTREAKGYGGSRNASTCEKPEGTLCLEMIQKEEVSLKLDFEEWADLTGRRSTPGSLIA